MFPRKKTNLNFKPRVSYRSTLYSESVKASSLLITKNRALSNHDLYGNKNDNVQLKLALSSTRTALYAHHAFLVHFFDVYHPTTK